MTFGARGRVIVTVLCPLRKFLLPPVPPKPPISQFQYGCLGNFFLVGQKSIFLALALVAQIYEREGPSGG